MSCVADANATTKAHTTKGVKPSRGSCQAMPATPAMMANCDSSSQLRRRPSQVVSTGRGKRSTRGAHTHLKP